MTIDEIFNQLSNHMVEGLMFHSQLSDYFGFLGLKGYQICHKYRYFDENKNYRKISSYYLCHYDKLIPNTPIKNPNLIPTSWYQYTRHDVDIQTRKNAIQAGIEKWVNWESATKKLYESLYGELIKIGEVSAAKELSSYIRDVDFELAEAYQEHLNLVAIDFDISDIIQEQDKIEKKCKKMLKEIKLYD